MRKLLIILAVLFSFDGHAQLYHGMAQPTRIRTVHSAHFTDNQTTFSNSFMIEALAGGRTRLLAGVSTNGTDYNVSVWNGYNFFDRKLWMLGMVNYHSSVEDFSADFASTYHIGGFYGDWTYRVNLLVKDVVETFGDRKYNTTFGARFTDRLAANTGVEFYDFDRFNYVFNLRYWIYNATWAEYRYNQNHSIVLMFQFN